MKKIQRRFFPKKIKLLSLNKKSLKWLIAYIKPQRNLWIVYTVIKSIISIIGVLTALIIKELVDSAVGATENLVYYATILGITLVIQLILRSIISFMNLTLDYKLFSASQRRIIRKCVTMEWVNIDKYRTGDLVTRINGDLRQANNIWMVMIPNFISLAFQFLTAFITLAFFDYRLAIIVTFITPLAMLVSWMVGNYLKPYQKGARAAESRFGSYLTDILTHILVIKVFQHENASIKKIERFQKKRYRMAYKRRRLMVFANIIVTIGYTLSLFGVFLWGSYQISLGLITFGTFTAYLQLINQVQGPVERISTEITTFVAASASVERIMSLESEPREKRTESKQLSVTEAPSIKMENISYRYHPKARRVLNDVSLEFNPGEKIAIVGPSGEGKTTFIRMLLRLVKQQRGKLNYNNQLIKGSNGRELFTYVPQGNTLFFGSVEDNLKVGKPDATDKELHKALRLADLDDFVSKTTGGLKLYLGENNSGLSQGQAQRIAIARACLRNAPIMILDEATSALDIKTEKKVLHNLFTAFPDKTFIIISHRKTVFDYSDRIIGVDKGRFIELSRSSLLRMNEA